MKSNRRVLLPVCIAGLVICVLALVWIIRDRSMHAQSPQKDPEGHLVENTEEFSGSEEVSVPVDFESWKRKNSDIYAWLEIPDTAVDYPIVQRDGDDSYYLRRDVDDNESVYGSIFTEQTHNATDFNDPVTVIYGHNMADGAMFGGLRPWICGDGWLDAEHDFMIYQPGRILKYRLVGGVAYDDAHLLYWNDFSDEYVFERFFEGLYDEHGFYNNLLPDAMPQYGDRVVILSTCMGEHQRYLIIGVLTEDTDA